MGRPTASRERAAAQEKSREMIPPSDQFAAEGRDRTADQGDARAFDAHLHDASAPRDLATGQFHPAQFLTPVRPQAAVCRAADGISSTPTRGAKNLETKSYSGASDRPVTMTPRTGSCARRRISGWMARTSASPSSSTRRSNRFRPAKRIRAGMAVRSKVRSSSDNTSGPDRLAGEIERDPVGALPCGQESAPRLEPRGLASFEEAFLPEDVRCRQGGMAAEIDLRFRGEPSEVERTVVEPVGEGRLGEVHLRCHILHPLIVGRFRQDADRGGIARISALCERVDLGDALAHRLDLGLLGESGASARVSTPRHATTPERFDSGPRFAKISELSPAIHDRSCGSGRRSILYLMGDPSST